MIVITGATGTLGSHIVTQLLELMPADQIGVSVRDPDKATDLADRGVRVRQGDFTNPSTLHDAFEGASQVLLISASVTGSEAIEHHKAAIDAAIAAGAERVLYTSHQAANAASVFAPMPDHAATEQYLTSLGASYTSLRNGFYASTLALLTRGAVESGEISAPADGPTSWTTHADLAEAAAIILADPGRFDGPTPALTASEAIDLDGVAGILSDISGHTIRRVVVDDEEWVVGMIARGVPEGAAGMLLGMFRASRAGEFSTVDPTLTTLLGRPTSSVRSVFE
jgi:NAD(P)H dehydrogenase (quinone)